jgi:hypothetical protein
MHIVVVTGSISMRSYGGVVGHDGCVGDYGSCVFVCWIVLAKVGWNCVTLGDIVMIFFRGADGGCHYLWSCVRFAFFSRRGGFFICFLVVVVDGVRIGNYDWQPELPNSLHSRVLFSGIHTGGRDNIFPNSRTCCRVCNANKTTKQQHQKIEQFFDRYSVSFPTHRC